MVPLNLLFEKHDLPTVDMPTDLERLYDGSLGFEPPCLYANFVSSLDGIVALEGHEHSSKMISGRSEADRFVMGLLRAFADAVLIGAGTFRAAPDSLWTPTDIFPGGAASFAELRGRLGRSTEARLVLITSRGDVDPHHPALESGALVLTSSLGASALRNRLPRASTVVAIGTSPTIDLVGVIRILRSEGHQIVLSEGGPTVIGGLLRADLLHELFLTISPILAGRSERSRRPGLVEGVELLPARSISAELLSIRTHGSHLFLRHAIPRLEERATPSSGRRSEMTERKRRTKGDFARGERTTPPPDEGPDFARGERTTPPPDEGPDFARGERTTPPPDEGPDFARGERTTPPPDEGPDFARGERTTPPPDEGPDFARGERTPDG